MGKPSIIADITVVAKQHAASSTDGRGMLAQSGRYGYSPTATRNQWRLHMTLPRFNRLIQRLSLLAALAALGACASTTNTPSGPIPSGAKVFFIEPADGATVGQVFKVKFGVEGMKVQPAGEIVDGTGHHHLLINVTGIATGESVPFSDQHLHFGKGQTETELKLAQGNYKLTLQFANGAHMSYGEKLSATINVKVK
jgi:hypothetical protein